ncbi:PP2C family protein-serine/threonine phosphatase [Mariniblastus fucicola]|uniref:Serine/threonine phosphatase stp n=1 Tax=Mariniblastus fucicola TaxID=980251 RepID=A0A5B9PJ40_9BACT|nr:protein phosphatase 2C domain-containing protein [Mariniblastus fucicola]QEG24666.1 Serine/threonine phosphatase stp [Mariniblastus fucicola]
MSINIDCFGKSDLGQIRPVNEDQFLIADLNKSMRVHQTSLGLSRQTRLFGGSQGKLLLVADGLGGHESGERASTLAVDGVASYVLNSMDWLFRIGEEDEESLEAELKQAFQYSQTAIAAEAEAIPDRRGMATTLTMAYISWPKLYVVHVGDTRCYHVRGSSISQLTTDHTMAQLARSVPGDQDDELKVQNVGSVNPTESRNPMENVLWNVVGGTSASLEPQIRKSELAIGDTLLLCSDGLTRHIQDNELLEMTKLDRPSSEICDQLVEVANARGGEDNITAVLARFREPRVESSELADASRTAAAIATPETAKTNVHPRP